MGDKHGFFKYTANINDEDGPKLVRGIVYGESYKEAAEKVENYYYDVLDAMYIYAMEPSVVFELDNDNDNDAPFNITIS